MPRLIPYMALALGPTLEAALQADGNAPSDVQHAGDPCVHDIIAHFGRLDLRQQTLMGVLRDSCPTDAYAEMLGHMAAFVGGGFKALRMRNDSFERVQTRVYRQYVQPHYRAQAESYEQGPYAGLFFFIKMVAMDSLYRPDLRDPESCFFLRHMLMPVAHAFAQRGADGLCAAARVIGCKAAVGMPSLLEQYCGAGYRGIFYQRLDAWHRNEYEAHTRLYQTQDRPPPMTFVRRGASWTCGPTLAPAPLHVDVVRPPAPHAMARTSVPSTPSNDDFSQWFAPPKTAELMAASFSQLQGPPASDTGMDAAP